MYGICDVSQGLEPFLSTLFLSMSFTLVYVAWRRSPIMPHTFSRRSAPCLRDSERMPWQDLYACWMIEYAFHHLGCAGACLARLGLEVCRVEVAALKLPRWSMYSLWRSGMCSATVVYPSTKLLLWQATR